MTRQGGVGDAALQTTPIWAVTVRNEKELKSLKTNNSAKCPHFTPQMISRAYARVAKPFVRSAK